MKTRVYKTLRGMISQSYGREINFNNFKAGQFCHNRLGWVNFRLPESERQKAYEMFASAIYSNGKANAYKLMRYDGRRYGILSRLTIICKHYGFRGDYCAGQDYPSEIRTIQKIIREN